MLSMWAFLKESDVEAYLASVVLPSYLSHLRLRPFQFSWQSTNCDGQEPLMVIYEGGGRLEEYALHPEEHTLPMIRSVCPRIDTSRIQLPRDDARWHWTTSDEPPQRMRIYFAPTTHSLCRSGPAAPSQRAYVSVSRGHVFIDRTSVESYLKAWLDCLGIDPAAFTLDFDTPSGDVAFATDAVGGQMFLDDDVIAHDLVRFAGLEPALMHVDRFAEVDMDSDASEKCGIYEDGVYIHLARLGPIPSGPGTQ